MPPFRYSARKIPLTAVDGCDFYTLQHNLDDGAGYIGIEEMDVSSLITKTQKLLM